MFVIASIMIIRERNKRSKNHNNLIKHCAQLNRIKNNTTPGITILTLINFTKILKLHSEKFLKFSKEWKYLIQSLFLAKKKKVKLEVYLWNGSS